MSRLDSTTAIPWLRKVPPRWRLMRGKTLFSQSRLSARKDDNIVTVFRDGQVTLRNNRRSDGFMLAEKEVGYQGVRRGQLVLHSMDAFAGAVGVSDSDGKCTPEYVILDPKSSGAEPRFFAAVLREMARQGFIQVSCPSVRERAPRIRFSDFGTMVLPVPSIVEQRTIADLLDRKTAAIDALVAKKGRLVRALAEKRRAIISKAVTRGLQPAVPDKDSGEQWLGRVPRHWSVLRAKFHLELVTSGSRAWGEYLSEQGPLFLQSGNLGDDLSLDLREVQRVQLPSRPEGARTLVRRGDVLVCITGAYTGNVAVVQEDLGEAYVNQHIALVRVDLLHVDPMFLGHYLASPFGAFQFVRAQYGGTKQGLGLDDVRNVVVPLPPLQEQRAIVAALASTSVALGRAAQVMTESIERLREYRQALITAAVTGQLNVAAQPQEAA